MLANSTFTFINFIFYYFNILTNLQYYKLKFKKLLINLGIIIKFIKDNN